MSLRNVHTYLGVFGGYMLFMVWVFDGMGSDALGAEDVS